MVLTPNKYDYVSIFARLTPTKFHQWFCKFAQRRAESDTFPTFYRANSVSALKSQMASAGLEAVEIVTLGHYPAYLMYSSTLFRLGAYFDKLVSKSPSLALLRGWILASFRKV